MTQARVHHNHHNLFPILYEDPDLLVINKPAGLVCHPTKGDALSSLISRVRLHLGDATHPHLVNRLDRETSGITLIAKRDEAARELRQLWENRRVEKEYLAIVHGHVTLAQGVIAAPLGKDEQSRVAIKDCVRPDGLPAETEFRVQSYISRPRASPRLMPLASIAASARRSETQVGDEFGEFSLLRVVPRTGRKHQIRIHLAHIGHPLVGDKLYGGDESLYLALVKNTLTEAQWRTLLLPYHALHARQISFNWRGKDWIFQAEPESWFTDWLTGAPR